MTQASLRIGMVCYPGFGGSGIVATELALGMAARGHEVHLITTQLPVRAQKSQHTLHFHRVDVHEYPLFQFPPYTMALASRLAEVAETCQLDILHLHYAIPHAVSGYLARQILQGRGPRLIVTLHGTDVTRVGCQPAYQAVTRMALLACDGLTTPSAYLREEAYPLLGLPQTLPIHVISNFVDTERFQPTGLQDRRQLSALFGANAPNPETPIFVHVSNFRPLKRIPDVIQTFAHVHQQRPARLLMIGDGPEKAQAIEQARTLGVQDHIHFLGKRQDIVSILQHSDVMLMPSETESFGLAALEAMSCGLPVVASDVGGLRELIQHGQNGYLAPTYDTEAMSQAALTLLQSTHAQEMRHAARRRALDFGDQDATFQQYEDFYVQTLENPQRLSPCEMNAPREPSHTAHKPRQETSASEDPPTRRQPVCTCDLQETPPPSPAQETHDHADATTNALSSPAQSSSEQQGPASASFDPNA